MSFPVFPWRVLDRGPKPQTSEAMVKSRGLCVCTRLSHCVILRSVYCKAPNMPFPSPKLSKKKNNPKKNLGVILILHHKEQSCVSSVFLRLHACVGGFVYVCVLRPLPVWLLDRVAWACLWLWLSDCPSGMKPAALLGRLNCWGRASTGALSSAKAKWNYTTDWTLQVVCVDSLEKHGWIKRKNVPPWLIGRFNLFLTLKKCFILKRWGEVWASVQVVSIAIHV